MLSTDFRRVRRKYHVARLAIAPDDQSFIQWDRQTFEFARQADQQSAEDVSRIVHADEDRRRNDLCRLLSQGREICPSTVSNRVMSEE